MKVSLVSFTQPVLTGHETREGRGGQDLSALTPEQLIVYCARVSSPQNQSNLDTAPKLLAYLIKNKHWSPFEMADLTVEVETSRAIAAQILRHWSFSFQEFSQRYATASMGFEIYEARLQGKTNRQGSTTEGVDEELSEWWRIMQDVHYRECEAAYQKALAKGIAKELARMLLPLATRTVLYMKASVRDWLFYLQARTDPHAQVEHQLVAKEILSLFKDLFPYTSEAFFGAKENE